MNEALKIMEMNLKNRANDIECPFRLVSFSEGLLCFDPQLAEYVKPAEKFIDKWCISHFHSCPNFLNYQTGLRSVIHKHFML